MKPKTYLTPDLVKKLVPGETYHLGYDDFNKDKFQWKFVCIQPGGDRCLGVVDIGDGDNPLCKVEFYQFNGPHRDGSMMPTMCRGSGAERVFFTRKPKLKEEA